MNETIIYIAGPMSGLPDFNHDAFLKAAGELRKAYDCVVINPARNYGGYQGLGHSQYMRYSIHQLLIATDIYMLKGWKDSVGARVEYEIANSLGLEVHFE